MCNTCNSSVYNRCSCGTTYGCQRICRDCCGNIRVNNNCGCQNGTNYNGCAQWLWNLLLGNTYCQRNHCLYAAQTANTNGFGCGYTAQTANTNGYGCGYTAQTTNGYGCGYTAQTTNGYGCGYTAQTATTGCRCGYNG